MNRQTWLGMVIKKRASRRTHGMRHATQWILYTKDEKRVLGKFKTKAEAIKRERQIQFFKHAKR